MKQTKTKTPTSKAETKVSKSQHDFNQRQRKAERMNKISALIHAGKTQEEISEMLGASRSTISDDCKKMREKWEAQAVETIDAWKQRELAYAVEQRTQAQIQWQSSKQSRYQDVMIRWTDRIAKLLGLDAPIKFKDVTREGLIAQAKLAGIANPEQDDVLLALLDTVEGREN